MIDEYNVRLLCIALCKEYKWQNVDEFAFVDCEYDYEEDGILYMNPNQSFKHPAELIAHLMVILGQKNGMTPEDADELWRLSINTWNSRN